MLQAFVQQALLAKAGAAVGEPVQVKFRIPRDHPNADRFMAVVEKLTARVQHPSGLVERRTVVDPDPEASFYQALEELVGPVMVYNVRRDLADQARAQGKRELAAELSRGLRDPSFVGGLMIASNVEIYRSMGHPDLQRTVNAAEAIKRGEIPLSKETP